MSSLGTAAHQKYRLGAVLRAARVADARFKRQEHLARHLGWPVKRIHQLEIGYLEPSPPELAKLRRVLPLLDTLLQVTPPSPREITVVAL